MIARDDIPLAAGMSVLATVGFIFAIIGKPAFDAVAEISKRNVLISKADIRLMKSAKFVTSMRLVFFVFSGWFAWEVAKIIVGAS